MRETRKQFASGLMLCTGLALGMAATDVHAQNLFAGLYGGSSNDAARGGVIRTSDGGFIAVGESQSFGNGDYDIYVVKTDNCGNLEWSTTYDFGGNDYGRKIRETNDGTGNFILVGSTDNQNSCCTHKGADIIVVNIDNKGGFAWAKTYGGFYDDQGTDIQLYNDGKEYVVSGRTSSFGAGDYDGYLMNIDVNGNVNWGRVYGGANYDSFNSVAISASGDILAGGQTRSYTADGLDQIWVARTTSKGNVQWARHYGPEKSNEVANSLIEVNDDRISVVGYTDNVFGKNSPFLLEIDSKGNCVCNNVFYYQKTSYGEFREVRAIANGDLAVAGYFGTDGPTLGSTDQLLVRIDTKCNVRWAHLYGGKEPDEAYSVDILTNPDQKEPDGFVIAGFSQSCCFGAEDLSITTTDVNGASCGCDVETKMEQTPLKFECLEAPTCEPLIFNWCEIKTKEVYNESYKFCCQKCDQKERAMPNDNDREHLGLNPDGVQRDGIRASEATPTVRTRMENNR